MQATEQSDGASQRPGIRLGVRLACGALALVGLAIPMGVSGRELLQPAAPVVREPILGGSGQISGNFTLESANNLAILMRAGALPAPLTVIE